MQGGTFPRNILGSDKNKIKGLENRFSIERKNGLSDKDGIVVAEVNVSKQKSFNYGKPQLLPKTSQSPSKLLKIAKKQVSSYSVMKEREGSSPQPVYSSTDNDRVWTRTTARKLIRPVPSTEIKSQFAKATIMQEDCVYGFQQPVLSGSAQKPHRIR